MVTLLPFFMMLIIVCERRAKGESELIRRSNTGCTRQLNGVVQGRLGIGRHGKTVPPHAPMISPCAPIVGIIHFLTSSPGKCLDAWGGIDESGGAGRGPHALESSRHLAILLFNIAALNSKTVCYKYVGIRSHICYFPSRYGDFTRTLCS